MSNFDQQLKLSDCNLRESHENIENLESLVDTPESISNDGAHQ